MYLEFRHLRTIRAIHQAGGLARAAEMLNMTQSALSHQVKGLEDQAGIELFVRRSKPMRLSAAGLRIWFPLASRFVWGATFMALPPWGAHRRKITGTVRSGCTR